MEHQDGHADAQDQRGRPDQGRDASRRRAEQTVSDPLEPTPDGRAREEEREAESGRYGEDPAPRDEPPQGLPRSAYF